MVDRRAALVVLPLAVAAAVAVWVAVLLKGQADTGYVSTYHPTRAAAPTKVLIVGDAYTAGAGGVTAEETYAPKVCAALDWVCTFDAEAGTGYVNDGKGTDTANEPYAGRLAAATSPPIPDVVVVTGGREDASKTAAPATAAYFKQLSEAFPEAQLVVVLPFWPDEEPPKKIQTLRQDVEAAALAANVTVVNADHLLTPEDIGPDGVNLTAAGQAQLATRLTSRLAAAVVS